MNEKTPFQASLLGLGQLGAPLKKHLIQKGCDLKTYTSKDTTDDLQGDSVFLAVPDHALDSVIEKINEKHPEKTLVHFSGSHYNEKALGVHPVYSFPKNADEIDFSKLHYVIDHKELPKQLEALFPQRTYLKPELKTLYHTYLSLTANYAQLLSHTMGESFEKKLGLSKTLLKDLLLQSLENEKKWGKESFSGPWVRGEKKRQDERVASLEDAPLNELNQNFLELIKRYEEDENNRL